VAFFQCIHTRENKPVIVSAPLCSYGGQSKAHLESRIIGFHTCLSDEQVHVLDGHSVEMSGWSPRCEIEHDGGHHPSLSVKGYVAREESMR
jgi:hypothetical protein